MAALTDSQMDGMMDGSKAAPMALPMVGVKAFSMVVSTDKRTVGTMDDYWDMKMVSVRADWMDYW